MVKTVTIHTERHVRLKCEKKLGLRTGCRNRLKPEYNKDRR